MAQTQEWICAMLVTYGFDLVFPFWDQKRSFRNCNRNMKEQTKQFQHFLSQGSWSQCPLSVSKFPGINTSVFLLCLVDQSRKLCFFCSLYLRHYFRDQLPTFALFASFAFAIPKTYRLMVMRNLFTKPLSASRKNYICSSFNFYLTLHTTDAQRTRSRGTPQGGSHI